MSSAIQLIVDGYVRLNDRKSLEDLLSHRKKLLGDLQGRSGFDYSSAICPLKEEISAIEAGLRDVEQTPDRSPTSETLSSNSSLNHERGES